VSALDANRARTSAGTRPQTPSFCNSLEHEEAGTPGQVEASAAGNRADFEHERERADRLMTELSRATDDTLAAKEAATRLDGELPALRSRPWWRRMARTAPERRGILMYTAMAGAQGTLGGPVGSTPNFARGHQHVGIKVLCGADRAGQGLERALLKGHAPCGTPSRRTTAAISSVRICRRWGKGSTSCEEF
jgi:hypothetical protein